MFQPAFSKILALFTIALLFLYCFQKFQSCKTELWHTKEAKEGRHNAGLECRDFCDVWLGDQLLNFHLIPYIWNLWHYKVARIHRPQDIAGILKDEVSISQLPSSLAQSIDNQNQCLVQFDNRIGRESEASTCIDGAIELSQLKISRLSKTFWILGGLTINISASIQHIPN